MLWRLSLESICLALFLDLLLIQHILQDSMHLVLVTFMINMGASPCPGIVHGVQRRMISIGQFFSYF